jgi:hypothetical protein
MVFCLEVSNLEQKSKNLNRGKTQRMFSVNENCDVECYRLFEELHLFSAVIPLNIFNIRDMFKFIIQRTLSEEYPRIFTSLGMTTLPVTTASSSGALFKTGTDKRLTSEQ